MPTQQTDEDQTTLTLAPPLGESLLPVPVAARSGDTSIGYDVQVATVAVVGLGYVGLPTALALHAAGMSVLGIDISQARLDTIRCGRPDLLDSDLGRLELARMDDQRFRLSEDPAAIADADCVLVCVPTPIDEHQVPDLEPLRRASAAVVTHARSGQAFVLTSTTYVGCTRDLVVAPLAERGLHAGRDVAVCFAPERIDPANIAFELSAVPKVIGGVTEGCVAAVAPILERISKSLHVVSSPEAAELTKLLENTFRAVNITLANEVADVGRIFGLDPIEVIDAAATKPYGFMPFYPGPGVGGHCIPCDPHYLLWQLRDRRVYPAVISSAMQGIATRPGRIVQRAAEVLELADKPLRGARVLVSGVAYKPNVADVRESPALDVIAGLLERGARVAIHDPHVESVTVDERELACVSEPVDVRGYDLVVVTCGHDAVPTEFYADADLVLDATYRMPDARNRFIP